MIDTNREANCTLRYNLSQCFFLNFLYAEVPKLCSYMGKKPQQKTIFLFGIQCIFVLWWH